MLLIASARKQQRCNNMKKWIRNTLLCLFAAVFLVSAVVLGVYFWRSYTQQRRYEALSDLRPTVASRPAPSVSATEGATEPIQTEPLYVTVTNPKTGESFDILSQFSQLYEMNTDLVGWLEVPGTDINYPVMHTPEDFEYYLYRNFDKESNKAGCLFTQAEADVFAPSDNITIYGHHMRDGSMFGQLNRYTKSSFREENPYIYFDTLTEMHTYEVISVFLTTATKGEGFAYHRFVDAADEKAFDEFVAACQDLSLYETGVTATYGDKLICLSTCEYTQKNGRLVVVAKQIA